MNARIIDGKKISAEIRAEIQKELEKIGKQGILPRLVAVLVGEDPASEVYVRMKHNACKKVGIDSETVRLPADTSQEALLKLVNKLNDDPKTHGILVQLPLPRQINENIVINTISVLKDVDCFHPYNVGKLVIGQPVFLPCTPAGIHELIIRSGVDPEGKHTVVIGRSNIVGKPIANMLLQKAKGANSTVTVCHTRTPDIAFHARQADILVVAAGRPEVITGDFVKPGAVVIDVGVNRVDDPDSEKGYRLVGDVHFESASKIASAITPVPGGVGPMTITFLLKNTLQAAQLIHKT